MKPCRCTGHRVQMARPARFLRGMIRPVSYPAYLDTYASGELARRIERGLSTLERCTVCPRDCGVNRLADERKLCRVGRLASVASYFPHFGEEDCLRGYNGSGTIFFSWCNLKCVFCQNWDVSNEGQGSEVTRAGACADDARAPGAGLSQHQFRHARARGSADPGSAPRSDRRAGCGCRSSTTRAPTIRFTACS